MGILNAVAQGLSAAGGEAESYMHQSGLDQNRIALEEAKDLRVQERRLEHTSGENAKERELKASEGKLGREAHSADTKYTADRHVDSSKYTADQGLEGHKISAAAHVKSAGIAASVHGPAMELARFQLEQAENVRALVDDITAARDAGDTKLAEKKTGELRLLQQKGDSSADLAHATALIKAASTEIEQDKKDDMLREAKYWQRRAAGDYSGKASPAASGAGTESVLKGGGPRQIIAEQLSGPTVDAPTAELLNTPAAGSEPKGLRGKMRAFDAAERERQRNNATTIQ